MITVMAICGAKILICLFKIKMQKNTIIEILKMIKVNNYYIDLIIKLQTGKIINYKNY